MSIANIVSGILRALGLGASPPPKPLDKWRPEPAPETPPSPPPAPEPRRETASPSSPPRPVPTPQAGQPVAVVTLRKDQASVSSPRDGQSREGTYRRPGSVPSGTYTARREGNGIVLSRGGSRVTTVYPYDQAGVNDLGLQFLTWQMLLNAVEAQDDATVRIDDRHPGDERPDDRDLDLDVDGLADLDPSLPSQDERDAVSALGALGYEPTRPDDGRPAAPEAPRDLPPVEVPTRAAPETTPTIPAPPAQDSWTPSGAYER